MTVAYWAPIPYRQRPGEMYRPVCRGCLDSGQRPGPVVPCVNCDARLSYTEPCPERRGIWRSWLDVCSLTCLNEAKTDREPPPPEPRRCAWCGFTFTPKRRSDARYCGPRCRQAKRRAQPLSPDFDREELRAFLDELDVQPGDVLAPRLDDVVAAAINRLMETEPEEAR